MFEKKSGCLKCAKNLPQDRTFYCYSCVPNVTIDYSTINDDDDDIIINEIEEEEEEEEEEGYCPECNGSGQGMYDGSACRSC